MTTALVGASFVKQLADSLGALDNMEFTADELARIDEHAVNPVSIHGGTPPNRGCKHEYFYT